MEQNQQFNTQGMANSGAVSRQRQEDDVVTIDLGEVFAVLWHHIWLLILVSLAAGIVGYCVSRFAIPEEFQSSTSIYILNRTASTTQTAVNSSEIQAGTYLTKDYAQMITSRTVLEKVIRDLNLDLEYDELKKKVDVETPTDTRIVTITVTDHDPKVAQAIAADICSVASQQIQAVMDIDAVNVVDAANLPTMKSAPSNSRNAAIAAIVALLIVCVILVIQYVSDNTIKTSDDIERYLGLSTLAQIPLDEALSENTVENAARKGKGLGKGGKKARKAKSARSSHAGHSTSSGSRNRSVAGSRDGNAAGSRDGYATSAARTSRHTDGAGAGASRNVDNPRPSGDAGNIRSSRNSDDAGARVQRNVGNGRNTMDEGVGNSYEPDDAHGNSGDEIIIHDSGSTGKIFIGDADDLNFDDMYSEGEGEE